MTRYVEIAVNVPQVSGVFHYHLPPELEAQVMSGCLVVVPFGQQTVQGIVLQEINVPEVSETRAVVAVVDAGIVVTPAQIALARRIAETTLAPLAACINLMLPVGFSKQGDKEYTLAADFDPDPASLSKMQTQLVKLLQKRGPLRGKQIERAFPDNFNWRNIAARLIDQGAITTKDILPLPTIRPKYVRTAQLAEVLDAALAAVDAVSNWRDHTKERRKQILEFLHREAEAVDVTWIYAETSTNLEDLQRLAEQDLVVLSEREAVRDPLAEVAYDPATPPQLTGQQAEIWERLAGGLDATANGEAQPPYLLHGVTGSGKTEIYLRSVERTLAQGKQAIVLVPEIALTPQTVRRFLGRFPGQVGLVHSGLSEGERYDTWRRARKDKLSVIVGPRSALFTPLPNIGLIILDESHDDSYYQDNTLPYYHARAVAVEYARILGAACILGSATPDVTSFYQASRGDWQLLELPERILAHKETVRAQVERLGLPSRYHPVEADAESIDLPPVDVIDMRAELRAGNRSIFSRALQNALGNVLVAKQQAIIFLNRRGTSTYVFCRDCGHVLRCPHDDMPLTFHEGQRQLICHHCGYQRSMPKTCPECGSERIKQYGMGTERVEEEIRAEFPGVRTLRWDWETTRQKGAHEIILSHFSNQRADVLVGTQMLAKGLDLPLVTLVGVVLADVGLNMPDYRAGERVFQVLAQVAGRAGRSPLGGQVVLQTFQPEHYVIQAAAAHDYAGFYQTELRYRRELKYPPFTQLVRLVYRHRQAGRAESQARELAARIREWLRIEDRRATEMIGPVPCFYQRLDDEYRWQIILRGPDPASVLRGKNLGDWQVQVNPQALL